MRGILTAAALSVVLCGTSLAQNGPVYRNNYRLEGVTDPVLTKEVKPNYTRGATLRKVEGVVRTTSVVLANGKVGDVTITQSLDDELDQQAIKAVKQWRFKPGTKDGKPVAVAVVIELTFTLRD